MRSAETYHGKPCAKAGHTLRYVKTGTCVECKTGKGNRVLNSTYIVVPKDLTIKRMPGEVLKRDEQNRKICIRCDSWKFIEEFSRNRRQSDGYSPYCKECEKWYQILSDYKLTRQMYEEILSKQDGHCRTCPSTEKLFVDHDHKCCPGRKTCGKCVRGILCEKCNFAIGYARDDVQILKNLIDYLQDSN